MINFKKFSCPCLAYSFVLKNKKVYSKIYKNIVKILYVEINGINKINLDLFTKFLNVIEKRVNDQNTKSNEDSYKHLVSLKNNCLFTNIK